MTLPNWESLSILFSPHFPNNSFRSIFLVWTAKNMGASYREWESRCQSPDRVITLIHEQHTIETCAHFSSPSELTALAFHNTIIIENVRKTEKYYS
jgi:hypothetical protein